jgi:hypothetical protein
MHLNSRLPSFLSHFSFNLFEGTANWNIFTTAADKRQQFVHSNCGKLKVFGKERRQAGEGN